MSSHRSSSIALLSITRFSRQFPFHSQFSSVLVSSFVSLSLSLSLSLFCHLIVSDFPIDYHSS